MEYAINERKNLLAGKKLGLDERDPAEFTSYEEFKGAFPRQLANLFPIAKRRGPGIGPRRFLVFTWRGQGYCDRQGRPLENTVIHHYFAQFIRLVRRPMGRLFYRTSALLQFFPDHQLGFQISCRQHNNSSSP